MERLKQQVKNKVTETKEKTGTAELEEDVLELTTKLNGMQSHVHELKSRVIPEFKLRNSRMKEELVRTIQNRMVSQSWFNFIILKILALLQKV